MREYHVIHDKSTLNCFVGDTQRCVSVLNIGGDILRFLTTLIFRGIYYIFDLFRFSGVCNVQFRSIVRISETLEGKIDNFRRENYDIIYLMVIFYT